MPDSSPKEALKKAKAQAATPLLAVRVLASEMYVARKKKRLEEAEVEVLEAINRPDVLKAEVRRKDLPGKAEVTRAASVQCQSTNVGGDEIAQLKARLVAAEKKRDAGFTEQFARPSAGDAPHEGLLKPKRRA